LLDRQQQLADLVLPRADPQQRLPPARVAEFRRFRADHLARHFARQAILAADRFDRKHPAEAAG
jgi:hypothetical protein